MARAPRHCSVVKKWLSKANFLIDFYHFVRKITASDRTGAGTPVRSDHNQAVRSSDHG
ncbi:hypothetical protein EMEDMD4_670008 [Sinorhizobium medicae]|uniref:Transposase n=1 Tax=Sinorhizobium medicae TaxID=110321 RepID=A0A508X9R8_9HYPH|nr:hypothetical protein EMEDMD4_670008 [Sinorhizobium medicae]